MYDDRDYIARYRKKLDNDAAKVQAVNDIIAQSLSKTEAFVNGALNAIPIVFINDTKEDGENSVIYTYAKDTVSVGDYLDVLGAKHLIYKQVKNLQQEGFINQFKAIACNISFTFKNKEVLAYYKGPFKSSTSTEVKLKDNFGIDMNSEAFIVVPTSIGLTSNERLVIGGEGWRTVVLDKLTNPGISYLSVEKYNIILDQKVEAEPIPETTLMAGVINELATENGYFQTSIPVEVVSKTATLVKFIIPFGISTITIVTKEDTLQKSVVYDVRG